MLARPRVGVAAAVAVVRQNLLAQLCKVVLLQGSKMLSGVRVLAFESCCRAVLMGAD